MKAPRILSPPVLRTAEGAEQERGASWLELFFDLVFVVAVAQLAVALANDLSAAGFLRFFLLFVPVWWAWVGYTMYADRFDTDDPAFRAMMLSGMLAIAALAVSIPGAFGGGSAGFAISYIAVRIVLIVLYERARRSVPSARTLCTVTMSAFGAGTTLWALSLLAPEPWRFGLWALALLSEGATPWVARRAMASVPVHASHLPERFGLFIIIVLGESLVAVIIGIGGADWHLTSAFVAAAGFLVAACLWWVYFDFADLADIGRGLLARNAFIYGHLPIAIGLTAAGVGTKKAILYSAESHLSAGGSWALCGGTALFLAGVSLVCTVSTRAGRKRVLVGRLAATSVVLLLAGIGPAMSSVSLVCLLLLTLLSLVTFEVSQAASRRR
jgi:low temperature requirement protein LtrA